MSSDMTDDGMSTPIPGTFQYRLLTTDEHPPQRIPPLADPQLAWLREIFTRWGLLSMMSARALVVRWQSPVLAIEHLLLGILDMVPAPLFAPRGPSNEVLIAAVEAVLTPGQTSQWDAIPVTDGVRHAIALAREEAHQRGLERIGYPYDRSGTGPLLLALTGEAGGTPREILARHGITYASLCADLSPMTFTR